MNREDLSRAMERMMAKEERPARICDRCQLGAPCEAPTWCESKRGGKEETVKRFRGVRRHNGTLAVVVEEPEGVVTGTLTHQVAHSPSGFECGYQGSGPSDLALSLAAEVIGPEEEQVLIMHGRRVGVRAWNSHQVVKRLLVVDLPRDRDWVLPAQDVLVVVKAFEKGENGRLRC